MHNITVDYPSEARKATHNRKNTQLRPWPTYELRNISLMAYTEDYRAPTYVAVYLRDIYRYVGPRSHKECTLPARINSQRSRRDSNQITLLNFLLYFASQKFDRKLTYTSIISILRRVVTISWWPFGHLFTWWPSNAIGLCSDDNKERIQFDDICVHATFPSARWRHLRDLLLINHNIEHEH